MASTVFQIIVKNWPRDPLRLQTLFFQVHEQAPRPRCTYLQATASAADLSSTRCFDDMMLGRLANGIVAWIFKPLRDPSWLNFHSIDFRAFFKNFDHDAKHPQGRPAALIETFA